MKTCNKRRVKLVPAKPKMVASAQFRLCVGEVEDALKKFSETPCRTHLCNRVWVELRKARLQFNATAREHQEGRIRGAAKLVSLGKRALATGRKNLAKIRVPSRANYGANMIALKEQVDELVAAHLARLAEVSSVSCKHPCHVCMGIM